MLRQSLRALGADPLALLEEAGIEPTRRAEEIDIAGFAALARAFAATRSYAASAGKTGSSDAAPGDVTDAL
jgi:hypothetical protein